MQLHPVVSQDEWLEARKELLRKEKEMTRLRDQLSAERRKLPWVKVTKTYVFDGPNGSQTLADLFDGRSQLIVKHFMLGPGWREGCVGCSFNSDHVDGALVHLEHHDVSFVAIARAPWSEIAAFKKRMGWRFPFLSSYGSDFNYDFGVSFTPEDAAKGTVFYNYESRPYQADELSGTSVFYKDAAGDIFHTYSTYARGTDLLTGTYNYLDITPKGRNETINGNLTDWVRLHDRYDDAGKQDADDCCHPA